jgi:endonuclease YncB( thermonuclease family)
MPNRIASPFLIIALALATAPGLAQTPAAPPAPVWPEKGSSTTGEAIAWDGDTIEIAGQAIRLHGIDAPEMGGDARGPVARGALDDILAPDRTATLRGAGHRPPQPSQPLYTLCGDTAEPDLPGAVTLSRKWIYFSGEKAAGVRKLLS